MPKIIDFNDIPITKEPIEPDPSLRVTAPPRPGLEKPQSIKQQAKEIVGAAAERGTSLAEAEAQIVEQDRIKQGFFGRTAKAWERGGEVVDIDFLWADVFRGKRTREEVLQQEEELRRRIRKNPVEGRNWAENLWLDTVSIANPMVMGQYKGLRHGTALGGTAFVLGQAGPQVATLEEVATIPSAFGVGHVYGTLSYWSEQGLGTIYREALEAGLDDKTARTVAAIGGPVYGAIEFSQVTRLVPGMRNIKRPILTAALRYFRSLATEVGEESAQKVVTEGSTLVGKLVDGMIHTSELPRELKEIGIKAFNEAKESLGPMSLLLLPGGAFEAGEARFREKAKEQILKSYVDKLEKAVEEGDIRKAQETMVEKEELAKPEAAGVAPEVITKPAEATVEKAKKEMIRIPVEDIELFDELRNNTIDFNKKRVSKKRQSEIIEKSKELRRELGRKGYAPNFVKAVEMADIGIPLPPLAKPPAIAEPAKPPAPPVTPPAAEVPALPEDRSNLIAEQLKTAKRVAPEVRAEQRAERRKRVGAAVGTLDTLIEKGVPPGEALDKSTGMLAGPLTEYKGQYESIRESLGNALVQQLESDIVTNENLQYFEKLNTKAALDSLIDGDYLTVGQAEFIARQFGVKSELAKIARRRVPISESITRLIAEIAGVPTTMLTAASGDMSGIMRQARPLGQVFPVEYVDFVKKYAQGWGSEEADIAFARATKELPFYPEEIDDGVLEVPRYGEEVLEPFERGEEFIGARLVERVPGIGQLVKMAERGFITGIGGLRSVIYNRLRKAAHRPTPQGHIYDNMTVKERKRLAGIINDASGRAHFARSAALRRWGPFLRIFFAPQFRFARMRMPFRLPIELTRFVKRLAAPKTMHVMTLDTGESVMRKEPVEVGKKIRGKGIVEVVEQVPQRLNLPELRMTTGAFASMVATNVTFMYLIKMAYMAWGGDPDEFELEIDPRSRNSGKIKIGNVKIDLWAGYLQDVQDYAQFVTGTAISQAGDVYPIKRKEILLRAIRRRSSPLASLIVDIFTEETVIGKRFGAPPKGQEGELLNAMQIPEYLQGATEEVWDRLTPLVLQDAMAAWIIEGVPEAITMGLLSHVGVSVATYEKWATSELKDLKNKIAQESYGKKWDKLSEEQQAKFEPVLEKLEAQVIRERPLRPRSRFISEEDEEVRDRMYGAMSSRIRKELEKVATDVGGISRQWGDFRLDDERFTKYEELYVPLAEIALSKLFRESGYRVLRNRGEKLEKIEEVLEPAKEGARDKLRELIKRNRI